MTAYYNEIDPKAAAWLRELIKSGHIAAGEVDERSIEDVSPRDLAGFDQCHFFAGIGGWSLALRLAGWADDRPVWTGSCPCRPFSSAGKGAGFADERHLWPAFFHLISQRRPPVVFGEQVASADGLVWLDLVQADLESSAYAVGAADLCAAGIGAPHIRQRLYWCAQGVGQADTLPAGLQGRERAAVLGARRQVEGRAVEQRCGPPVGGMADANGGDASAERQQCSRQQRQQPQDGCADGLADTERDYRGCQAEPTDHVGAQAYGPADRAGRRSSSLGAWPGPADSFWRDADWLACRDGKWRPVEPGTFPLAHGLPARVGRLRGYGNAIVPQVAAAFVRAVA